MTARTRSGESNAKTRPEDQEIQRLGSTSPWRYVNTKNAPRIPAMAAG